MHLTKFRARSYPVQPGFYLFAFVLCLSLLSGCATVTERFCTEQRTAFDIGSATMKMKTARINTCRRAPVMIISHQEVKVPFAEETRNQNFSRDIQNRGIERLQALKEEAMNHGAQKFAGVATAAFRQADNASEYLAEIKDKTGITIRLISQEEEAVLGYKAAIAHVRDAPGNIVVWDIGGNSMQMVMKDKDHHYRVYRGQLASISFKNQIIEKVQRQSAGDQTSPNPIGGQNLLAALEMAMNAAADVPDEINRCLRQPGTTVIGIGGVHNQSIRKQLGGNTAYHRADIRKVLGKKLDLTDAQIGGPFADTDVSNLILVWGFMQKLEIAEVRLEDVNLTDGILSDPEFWNNNFEEKN